MSKELQEGECYVALTHNNLDAKTAIDRVRSPKAGAIVLFAGDRKPPYNFPKLTDYKVLLVITSMAWP